MVPTPVRHLPTLERRESERSYLRNHLEGKRPSADYHHRQGCPSSDHPLRQAGTGRLEQARHRLGCSGQQNRIQGHRHHPSGTQRKETWGFTPEKYLCHQHQPGNPKRYPPAGYTGTDSPVRRPAHHRGRSGSCRGSGKGIGQCYQYVERP